MSLESKKARDICGRTPDIGFERDRLIYLGSTFGDKQTHTHTHTQTDIFEKLFFGMWECYRIENHKKIQVEFFGVCNTFFTPNFARK